MQIKKNETTETLAGIGPVAFEPLERAGSYWRDNYNRTHSQSFSFEADGRRYWGTIVRTFDRSAPQGRRVSVDVELRTDSGKHSRALPEGMARDEMESALAAYRAVL